MPADCSRSDASTAARLATDAATARRLIDVVADSFDQLATAVGASEDGPDRWTVAIHFRDPPNETAVRALIGLAAGPDAANALVFETTAARDWVKASLEGLTPVDAGRFVVHGSHDRGRVAPNRIAIEIEAGLAFGTGHHATTRGCLLALDRIVKLQKMRRSSLRTSKKSHSIHARHANAALRLRRRAPQRSLPPCGGGTGRGVATNAGVAATPLRTPPPQGGREQAVPAATAVPRPQRPKKRKGERQRTILDVGTGTGVLAIAAARVLRRPVVASDIDPVAVRIARDNARLNRVGGRIDIVRAAGLGTRRLRGRYDLVLANILLAPLQRMATPVARIVAPNGWVVLSGLLRSQASAALAAYRMRGFVLEQSIPLDGWMTLVLCRRRGVAGRRSGQ